MVLVYDRGEQQRDLGDIKLIMSRHIERPYSSSLHHSWMRLCLNEDSVSAIFLFQEAVMLISDVWVMYTGWGDNPQSSLFSVSLLGSPPPPAHAGPPAEAQQGCQVILNTNHSLSTNLFSPHPPTSLLPSPNRSLNLHYNEDGRGGGGGIAGGLRSLRRGKNWWGLRESDDLTDWPKKKTPR